MENNDKDSPSILTLSSKIDREKGQFILTVSDTGSGIDDDLLPHLFEPYKTTKTKGTGLGLAIVKRIVEEHDGYVIATNNQIRGASVSIHLPLYRV